jgi:hypothetical protein
VSLRTVFSPSTVRWLLHPAHARVLTRACTRAVLPIGRHPPSLTASLDATYRWLCAAQDAAGDGGVAACYNLGTGWACSYPETTGYIIPTFLHYAAAMGAPAARERALRMADWEIDVQQSNGAVRSGPLDVGPSPAVFNTGQVLFGWMTAYAATGADRYARSASRAADWLIRVQDADGAWRRELSALTTSVVQTYNVRAAWGLAVAGDCLGRRLWIDAARRNCDWALTQQRANGWFASNTFTPVEDPLLHTIGYVLEGLLGVGELLGIDQYVRAAIRGVDPLVEIYRRDRVLKGRYTWLWRPAVSWRCLTGEAQSALVLLRLARRTGRQDYRTMAMALLDGLSALQDLRDTDPVSHGALAGSAPVWGGYMPFNYLNWAAKFFVDALLFAVKGIDVQWAIDDHRRIVL